MNDLERELPEELFSVGATDEVSTRLWFRATVPGEYRISIAPSGSPETPHHATYPVLPIPEQDGTESVKWPDDLPGARPLEPGTAYLVELRRPDGGVVGRGRFETAPASIDSAPDRFSIALMSCNQPFDDEGRLQQASLRELWTLETAFAKYDVKRVILLGDQMYADYPTPCSLFDEDYFKKVAPVGRNTIFECTREEVRALYQRRYRAFWKTRAFQDLQANRPCYPTLDDHELVDNFGSSPEHDTAKWLNIREGALDACFDYQSRRLFGCRDPRPQSLHSSFVYGPVAAFIMDLRSERRADGERMQVFGPSQFAALEAFLLEQGERPVFILGLSVPLVHVPDWIANLGVKVAREDSDPADRWSYEKAKDDRDRLIALLSRHQLAHPHQRLVLLGGDIHSGLVSRVKWSNPPLTAWQLISSAVSNVESKTFRLIAQYGAKIGAALTMFGNGVGCEMAIAGKDIGHGKNPFGGLNVGLVEVVRADDGGYGISLKLLSHDDEGSPNPIVAYETRVI